MLMTLSVLGQDIVLDCASGDERRLEDLAAALEVRLKAFTGDGDALRSLVLTSLSLMDEAQATSAALVRARHEIERLTDMLVEAKLGGLSQTTPEDERGRVDALRVAHGAA